jgi:hypothetical protein
MTECKDKYSSRCMREAMPGHMQCNPCRVAAGGYNRYNKPPAKSGTQNSSKTGADNGIR